MIYLIYKTNDEKKSTQKDLTSINNFIYKKTESTKVDENVKFIDYYSLFNTELLDNIIRTNATFYTANEDIYYKFYDKDSKDKEYYQELINITTFYNSGNDNSPYLNLFYNVLNNKILGEYTNIKEKLNMLDSMTMLALYAFANRYDVNSHNDLIKSFLFDRELIKKKYEKVMGEGSFDELNANCLRQEVDFRLNKNNVSSNEFDYITDHLRDYFYENVTRIKDISFLEKNEMIVRFNKTYNNIKKKQKRKRLKKML